MKHLLFICLFSPFIIWGQNPSAMLDHLISNDSLLSEVCGDFETYEVQIIYTQIDRDKNNHPHFKSFKHQVPSKQYFYPASTVKMPAAFFALEKLNQLGIIELDKYSRMTTGAARSPQTAVSTDASAENHFPSLAHYIRKIFAVSDNEAYNRLYEFLGQEYFNTQLAAKGFHDSRIIHRLGPGGFPFSPEDNRYTNPCSFSKEDQLLYHQGEVYSHPSHQLQMAQEQKGIAHYKNGKLVEQAFDFSHKNYVSLENLHDILQAVLFPMAVPQERRFDFSEDDYRFLYQCLSIRPRESLFPKYEKPDGYVKFFIYGGEADSIPAPIRIFNKVGWAYGYLTDVAYIIDFENQIEFMLAATIHVNANQTYNDDNYEYESIGMPFFELLGKAVYEYEKTRPRTTKPDLSRFRIAQYK